MRRIPDPAFGFSLMEATTGFEPVMGVLQTPALPLGYVATSTWTNKHPPRLPRADALHHKVGAEEET